MQLSCICVFRVSAPRNKTNYQCFSIAKSWHLKKHDKTHCISFNLTHLNLTALHLYFSRDKFFIWVVVMIW